MVPNLTSAYMAGEIERSMFETRAVRRRLIDEAKSLTDDEPRAGLLRHRLAILLMWLGSRLAGSGQVPYQTALEESLGPAHQAQP